ncbi:MAG: flippase [Bacteroidales bacterium]|nr:flippase [Bacteroidales bacterium]
MEREKHIDRLRRKAENNMPLIRNFSYLSLLQVFNLILPLIVYPYLIRVLGKETYGLVVFAQSLVFYLVILVGFGFNISATKEVSIHRNDSKKLGEIVSSVLILKTMLLAAAFMVLGLLLLFIEKTRGYEILFLLSMWACLSDVIFPVWYFQGIEQMKHITRISILSRLIFLGLLFVFARSPEDYLVVPLLYGTGAVIAGMVALYIVFIKHGIRFSLQPWGRLREYLRDSAPIFVSNVSISLYVNTNKVIAGAFLGMTGVAYYDLAEKIVAVLKIPQNLVSQSLFPRISKEQNLSFVKKISGLSLLMNTGLFLLAIIFSRYIILLLGGKEMLPAQTVVWILSLTVPVVAMSNILGIQLLIPFGHNRLFSRAIVATSVFYLALMGLIWISTGFSIVTISVATVITEIFCCTVLFHYCRREGLWRRVK